MSSVLRDVLEVVGCRKIYTFAFHPQTDGMIESFSRALCKDLAKTVLHDEHWNELIRLDCFQDNTSVRSCTGISPCRAMYSQDPFGTPDARWGEMDDKGKLNVSAELRLIHDVLYRTAIRARSAVAKACDMAVKGTPYDVGDRVFGALAMSMIGCAGPSTPSKFAMYHTLVAAPAFLATSTIDPSAAVLL
jgi:hypothetical protein